MAVTLSSIYASEQEQNLAIEQFVQDRIDNPLLSVSDEDKKLLLKYTGRGQGFNQNAKISADAGLYEFYTPDYIRDRMWQLAHHYGYDGGPVLEPSCATGHLFLGAPTIAQKVGFEINPITAKIAQLCFPDATIHNLPFETIFMDNARGRFNKRLKNNKTWLPQFPFSLVIGNPPYGAFQGRYVSYFEKWMQVEHFFLYYSLLLCKPGGLVVFLTASSWLRNGNSYEPYQRAKL